MNDFVGRPKLHKIVLLREIHFAFCVVDVKLVFCVITYTTSSNFK